MTSIKSTLNCYILLERLTILCLTKPHPLLKPLEPRWINRSISDLPILQFLFHRSSKIWYCPGTSLLELMFCAFAREEEEDLFSWCVIPNYKKFIFLFFYFFLLLLQFNIITWVRLRGRNKLQKDCTNYSNDVTQVPQGVFTCGLTKY